MVGIAGQVQQRPSRPRYPIRFRLTPPIVVPFASQEYLGIALPSVATRATRLFGLCNSIELPIDFTLEFQPLDQIAPMDFAIGSHEVWCRRPSGHTNYQVWMKCTLTHVVQSDDLQKHLGSAVCACANSEQFVNLHIHVRSWLMAFTDQCLRSDRSPHYVSQLPSSFAPRPLPVTKHQYHVLLVSYGRICMVRHYTSFSLADVCIALWGARERQEYSENYAASTNQDG